MRTLGNRTPWLLAAFIPVLSGCFGFEVLTPESQLLPGVTSVARPFEVFGQKDLFGRTEYGVERLTGANTLYFPFHASCGGGYCYVIDAYSHRILVYAGVPTDSSVPIAVLGQTSFTRATMNGGVGSVTASGMYYPIRVIVASGRLYVADYANSRVMVWRTLPTTSNAPADFCLGQASCTSGGSTNRGAGTAASQGGLYYPMSIAISGSRLFVADYGNSRVLIYNSLPDADGALPDVVVGQADFVSGAANRGGAVAANTLSRPQGVIVAGTKLLIADTSNNRVLIYSSIPAANDASANFVIGQAALTTNAAGLSSTAMTSVKDLFEDSGLLWVIDYGNNRVLHYSAIPGANGVAADAVIGQPDFVTKNYCPTYSSSGASATCLRYPYGMSKLGSGFAIADAGASRILIYNSAPTATNVAADSVIGQSSLTSSRPNRGGGPNARGFMTPTFIDVTDRWLVVSESSANRVLLWPKDDPQGQAQYVLGQADFESTLVNRGGAPAANTLSDNNGVAHYGSQLYVAERSNHRILVYDLDNLSNGMNASYVLGQANFTSGSSNRGGTTIAKSLSYPIGLKVRDGRLYVGDGGNYRLLAFDLPIASNEPTPAAVYLQPNDTSATFAYNGHQVPWASTFGFYGTGADTVLAVCGGGGSNGVWFFPFTATPNYATFVATGVLGHSDFNGTNNTPAPAANTVATNLGNAFEAFGYFFIADRNAGRVLVWKGKPTPSLTMSAEYVMGKASLTTSQFRSPATADGSAPLDFDTPYDFAADDDHLYITDRWAYRVLKIPAERIPELLNQ